MHFNCENHTTAEEPASVFVALYQLIQAGSIQRRAERTWLVSKGFQQLQTALVHELARADAQDADTTLLGVDACLLLPQPILLLDLGLVGRRQRCVIADAHQLLSPCLAAPARAKKISYSAGAGCGRSTVCHK